MNITLERNQKDPDMVELWTPSPWYGRQKRILLAVVHIDCFQGKLGELLDQQNFAECHLEIDEDQ